MDLNEIKTLLGKGGGKIVIVEDDKPVMVILSYNDYREQPNPGNQIAKEETPIPRDEELTVDDLPL
ncbi:MAG: hypothetical protein HYS52_00785 [Candidatus Wildermuthbacteria bacterium]|nr:hypothetical protein [Candidatus Wildermuthbacteria bacterium]